MNHPYDSLKQLARPQQALGVSSATLYAERQARVLADMKAAFPMLSIGDPWNAPDGAIAWAAGGKWIVTCICGDAPIASPEWDIARCLACGAVYRNILWPEDREALENVLCVRPSFQRTWRPPQTLDDLRAENAERGLGEL